MARRKRRLIRHKGLDYLYTFALLAGIGLVVLYLDGKNTRQLVGNVQLIDGDSLQLDGQEVRLKGVDAPEGKQNCAKNRRKWPCGRESSQYLQRLISNHQAQCKGHAYDQYDRLLADCRANGVELNRMMVRNGWAVAFGDYEQDEAIAKREKKGIWAGEFDTPKDWRRHNRYVDQWSN